MAIPKTIYQTYINNKLPLITKFFIRWMKFVNRDYRYEFYDDKRVEEFLQREFPPHVYEAYKKIAIGASKGDFFRYAILYKNGGVYIDIDGGIVKPLSNIILPDDQAVLSKERISNFYCQWALIYDKSHPFLERTLQKCVDNINNNRFPHDVHAMTGPTAYTEAVNECLAGNKNIPHRVIAPDYEREQKKVMIPKHFLNRVIYFRKEHWAKTQKKSTTLKVF